MRLLQYNSCINGFFVVNIFELFPTAVYHVKIPVLTLCVTTENDSISI